LLQFFSNVFFWFVSVSELEMLVRQFTQDNYPVLVTSQITVILDNEKFSLHHQCVDSYKKVTLALKELFQFAKFQRK